MICVPAVGKLAAWIILQPGERPAKDSFTEVAGHGRLTGFGTLKDEPKSAGGEFLMAIAGPAVSAVLAIVFATPRASRT
jgi:hypothetical protein